MGGKRKKEKRTVSFYIPMHQLNDFAKIGNKEFFAKIFFRYENVFIVFVEVGSTNSDIL